MLARPEPGSRAHILLWLASMPARQSFHWADPALCACGQYSLHAFGDPLIWYRSVRNWGGPWRNRRDTPDILEMNRIAGDLAGPTSERPITFGRLHKAMREAWAA